LSFRSGRFGLRRRFAATLKPTANRQRRSRLTAARAAA
jgi:hypothetical protein